MRKAKPKKPQLTCDIYVTKSWVYVVTVTRGGDGAMREALQRVPYSSGECGSHSSTLYDYKWTRLPSTSSINIFPK